MTLDSSDFADLFDPSSATPRGYVPPGTIPPVLPAGAPVSWRQAAERAQGGVASPQAHGSEGTWSYTDDGAAHDLAEDYLDEVDEVAELDPDSAEQRRRFWRKRTPRPERGTKRARKNRDSDESYTLVRKKMRPRMTGTASNITYSKTDAIAWFYQPPGAWTMREASWQRKQIDREAKVLARLADRGITTLHRRAVRAPWPVEQWARAHDDWASPLPDVAGALSWSDYLAGQQAALLYTHPTLKLRFWGVYLPKRGWLAEQVETVASWVGERDGAFGWRAWIRGYASRVAEAEIASNRELLADLERIMASDGVRARPTPPGLLNYLLTRSASIGLPMESSPTAPAVGGDWTETDVAALAEASDAVAIPNDDFVQVTGTINGVRHTGYVIVVTIGRMGRLDIPESMLPWQVIGDAADATLEWSERLTLIDRTAAGKDMRKQSDKITAQWDHYTKEHDEDPPQALKEQYSIVKNIRNDLEHDHSGFTTRVKGVWRIAVVGSSPDDVRQKVAVLREVYEPLIQLHQEHGQFQLWREFLPCEKQANTAHTRRMPVRTAAAGQAAVGDNIGDRVGITIGETASIARRPVCWDPFYAMERAPRRRSGLTPVVAIPGSGKTFLCGVIVYFLVRAGAFGVILDPSGPLKALATIPELKPFTRVVELTGARTRPGALNPYHVIVDPRRDDDDYHPDNPAYADETDRQAAAEAQYEADVLAAQAERRQTTVTVLRMMLGPRTRDMQWTTIILNNAASAVGGERNHDPGEVIDAIAVIGDDTDLEADMRSQARAIAGELNSFRNLREARVLFSPAGTDHSTDAFDADDNVRLTILTMPGLHLPPKNSDESLWSQQQRMTAPLMHLAAWQANRLVYDLPRSARKVLFLDENKYLKETGAGRTLNQRIARDSRKYNVRALVASQLPDDFLGLADAEDDQSALTNEVIIGDLGENANAIAGALKLLNLPPGQGYEAAVANLSRDTDPDNDDDLMSRRAEELYDPRRSSEDEASRFLIKMGQNIENVICDFSNHTHIAHVLQALKSDPGADATAQWIKTRQSG